MCRFVLMVFVTMSKKENSVGYRNPPKHSRFRKGKSGNPGGRRPKSRNLETLLNDELEQKVSVTERGVKRRISKREAIIKTLVDGALKQDPRSLLTLLTLMKQAPARDPLGALPEELEDLKRALKKREDKS